VSTAPSWVAKPTEDTAVNTNTADPSFMPNALPVGTDPIYTGLGPTQGSAGFCAVTFGFIVASLGHWPLSSLIKMFRCCCEEVYDVCVRSCYMEARRSLVTEISK